MGLFDWLNEELTSAAGGGSPLEALPGGKGLGRPGQPSMSDVFPSGQGGEAPPMPPPGGAMDRPWAQPAVQETNQYNGAGGDIQSFRPPPPMPQPAAEPAMPPPAPPGLPAPAGPYPAGTDPMTAGGPTPNGPGLAPPGAPPPAPLPVARPPMEHPGAPPGLPPPVIMAQPSAPPTSTEGRGFSLLRAMGLDGPTADRMRGSLAAGLKSVPGNAHAPGLAAFAGSAGAGMEGGKNVADKHLDQQDKYLTRAIAAAQVGNTAAANQALTELRKAQTQQIKEGRDKGSVMNSTEQLYLRGLGAVNQDPKIKASAATLRELEKANAGGTDTPQIKAARAAHNALIEGQKKVVLGNLGISEKDAAKIGQQPGFSDQNPVKNFPKDPTAAKKHFDGLPDGAYFINPKDGRLLIKQSARPAAGVANPPAMPQSPPTAPPMLDPAQTQAPVAADEED